MAAKLLTASGVLYDERRQFYLEPYVTAELWPSVAPFTTVVSQKPIRSGLADPVFKQFEHRSAFINQGFYVNDAGPANVPNDDTGVTVNVDGAFGLTATADASWIGYTVEVWNAAQTTLKGQGIVSAVASGTAITVKSLNAAAFSPVLADNDVCYLYGNGQGEESEAPEAWADELRIVWGNTQMMETPINISNILAKSALRGYSSELARLREEKNKEFKMLMEKTFLFGTSINGTNLDVDNTDTFGDAGRTVSAKKVRTTMGLVTAIEKYGKSTGDGQNKFTISEAAYDYGQFVDDMEKVFYYYPEDGVKYAFCGPGAMSYWSKVGGTGMAENSNWKVQISDMRTTKLGFAVKMLETPSGVLALVPTPAFRGPRNKWMVVISEPNLVRCQFEAPMFKTNIKTENNYKGIKDVYFADEGLGMTLIESHKLFKIVA